MVRVFLADDMAPVREVIGLCLAAHPGRYSLVGEAATGPGALEGIGRLSPDVIVLDVDMPGLNGLEVVSELRRYGNGTPVILCTSAEGELPEDFPSGIVAQLRKPFQLAVLLEAIDAAAALPLARSN